MTEATTFLGIPGLVARLARCCGWLTGSISLATWLAGWAADNAVWVGFVVAGFGAAIVASALAILDRPTPLRVAVTTAGSAGLLWVLLQRPGVNGLFTSPGPALKIAVAAILAACGVVLLAQVVTAVGSRGWWTYLGALAALTVSVGALLAMRIFAGPYVLAEIYGIDALPNIVFLFLPTVTVVGLLVTPVFDWFGRRRRMAPEQ